MVRYLTGMALLACAVSFSASAQQQPAFKSGTQIVALYATVTDADKRLVADLTRDDFEILDNDQPQPLALFDNQVQPITVPTMLDTSGSMTGNLEILRQGAEQFFLRLLPEDRAAVGSFNDKVQFETGLTSNRDELIRALKELDFGNPTRLWDAVDASLDMLKGVEGRRVALIFTDGDDTASRIGMKTVLARARADEVMIYAIGMQSEYFNGQRKVRSQPDRGLRTLAAETGGGYFELKKTTDLGPTFTQIAQELHSQYVLGFTPVNLDGKVHKLTVRVKRPGMTARARKSYLAVPGTATAAGTAK